MNAHFDVDEIECPDCKGKGGWMRADLIRMEFVMDTWILCHRCQGAGTILIKIKKERVEKE